MSRTLICIIVLLSFSSNGIAQRYIEKIAENSCECISGIKLSDDPEMKNKQLGACLLKYAAPYNDRLKKDFNIDISAGNYEDSYKLGQKIAMKMMEYCPELLVMASTSKADKKTVTTTNSSIKVSGALTGEILEIENGQFNSIHLRASDRNHRFLWLNPFKNSQKLIDDPEKVMGRQALIEFREEELYDPKLGQYRKFKVITSLSLFDE